MCCEVLGRQSLRGGGGGGLLRGWGSDAAATTLLLVSCRGRCSTAPVFGVDTVGELSDEGVEGRGGIEVKSLFCRLSAKLSTTTWHDHGVERRIFLSLAKKSDPDLRSNFYVERDPWSSRTFSRALNFTGPHVQHVVTVRARSCVSHG